MGYFVDAHEMIPIKRTFIELIEIVLYSFELFF